MPSQATVPSVFVKIRSPNHPPHHLGHPHGQKNLLRSPRLTFFKRRPKFRPKYQIHPLSGAAGWGLLFRVGTKNANNNFLCRCLAETGAMSHNKKSCNIQDKNNSNNNNNTNNIEMIVCQFQFLSVERTLTLGTRVSIERKAEECLD